MTSCEANGKMLRYLRVSLTDRCNFRCSYCMPPQGIQKISHDEILRYHEVLWIIGVMAHRFGVRKVRVTGGEPLVRRGVCDFLTDLCRIPGLVDVSLTTNGYLLEEMAGAIHAAGVRRINISLDTFDRELFRRITGVDGLDQTLRGVDAALSRGFSPVKLNVVVLESNMGEVLDFVAYGRRKGVEVRFIEQMPGWDGGTDHVPNGAVKRLIESRHALRRLRSGEDRSGESDLAGGERGANGGDAAVRYAVDGGASIIGFVSPMSEPFCAGCDRIRLRGDGKLLPCLMSSIAHDLMPCVRPVQIAEDLEDTIRRALRLPGAVRTPAAGVPHMPRIGG